MSAVLAKPNRAEGERLSLELIEASILWLMQEGKPVSERTVRELLRGSPNDILPLMRRWYAERAPELLAGRLVVMDKESVPEPLLALYKGIVEEAGRAADARIEGRLAELEAERARLEQRAADQKREADELGARARTIESIVPTLKAELEIARADAAAQRSATDRLQAEHRESVALLTAQLAESKQAASEASKSAAVLGTLRDAAEARVAVLEATNQALQAELDRVRGDGNRLRAEIAESAQRHQAQMDSLQAAVAAQRVAHQREVEAVKDRHADAAGRWADAKQALEGEVAGLKSSLADAQAAQRVTEEMLATLQSQLDDERRLRKRDKEKLAGVEASLREATAALAARDKAPGAG